MTKLKIRFSLCAVCLPQRTIILPKQVKKDIPQTEARNNGLSRRCDIEDIPKFLRGK